MPFAVVSDVEVEESSVGARALEQHHAGVLLFHKMGYKDYAAFLLRVLRGERPRNKNRNKNTAYITRTQYGNIGNSL